MANFNKYDARHNDVHETLNKPIHKFINVGNALITIILLIFIILFNCVKVDQYTEQSCFLKVIHTGEKGVTKQAVIILQRPFTTLPKKQSTYSLTVAGNTIEISIDSVIDHRRMVIGMLPSNSIKMVPKLDISNGVFATFKQKNESITFFQIFYRRLIHI